MAESTPSSDQRVAELFEICRALHRESYPQSSLDFDRLDLTRRVAPETSLYARGGFSDVYEGRMDDGTVVAVKTLRLPIYTLYEDNIYQNALRRFFREINIWSSKEHTNVAPCLGYTLTGANISLISPWHSNGNLVQFLQAGLDASEPDLILDVAEGTQYLHTCSKPLIHGDLKGANILVSEQGIARLADFGISRQIDDMNRKTGFTTTSGVRGTIPWMAPELMREPLLTFPCDVYSCGGVFLEICCPGKRPYHYLHQDWDLFREKDAGTPPDLAHYPEIAGRAPLRRIMCACWAHDPLDRPNITSVVQSLYNLFKLSPRISQMVALRPTEHSRTGQDGTGVVEGRRLGSVESGAGDSALAEAEARSKKQSRKMSESGPESGAAAPIDSPIGDLSALRSPSPSEASSSSGIAEADNASVAITMSHLMGMDLDDIPTNHLKRGNDWHAIFNPQATPLLDISLFMTLDHDSIVWCVRLSPDGKYLASGSDGVAYVYDTASGRKIHTLEHDNSKWHEDPPKWNEDALCVYSISFSPDGKLVATGASDSRLRIWDLAERKIRTVFDGHTGLITSVAFSPDGGKIASGSQDRTCRIWDLQTGDAIVPSCIGSDNTIFCVGFSPDGSLVAAGYFDRIVRVWDAVTGELVVALEGHTHWVQSLLFTPDGKNLISGSFDKSVKCWSLESLPESRTRTASSSKGAIVSLGQDTTIQESGEMESRCTATLLGHKAWVRSVTTSHDGSWVVAGSNDGTVGFWDTKNPETPQLMLQGHKRAIYSVDMGPPLTPGTSGGLLATGSDDCSARIWRYNYL